MRCPYQLPRHGLAMSGRSTLGSRSCTLADRRRSGQTMSKDGPHECHHLRNRTRERVGGREPAGHPRHPLAAERGQGRRGPGLRRTGRIRGRTHPGRGLRRPRRRPRGTGRSGRPASAAGRRVLRRRDAAGRRVGRPGRGRVRRRTGLGRRAHLVDAALDGSPVRASAGRRSRCVGGPAGDLGAVARAGHLRARAGRRGAPGRRRGGRAGPLGVLLDARAAERYRGDVEPIDRVGGHIPGAVSAPTAENVAQDGRFLPAEALASRFKSLGASGDSGEVGVYCGSGVSGAHEVLALAVAGIDAALYVGSWSEGPRTSHAPWRPAPILSRASAVENARGGPHRCGAGLLCMPFVFCVRLAFSERLVASPASCGGCRRRSRPSSARPRAVRDGPRRPRPGGRWCR